MIRILVKKYDCAPLALAQMVNDSDKWMAGKQAKQVSWETQQLSRVNKALESQVYQFLSYL